MTPLPDGVWRTYKMSMRLSCDLACARKIINLFIINANDSNCKETQTFPYCKPRSQLTLDLLVSFTCVNTSDNYIL